MVSNHSDRESRISKEGQDSASSPSGQNVRGQGTVEPFPLTYLFSLVVAVSAGLFGSWLFRARPEEKKMVPKQKLAPLDVVEQGRANGSGKVVKNWGDVERRLQQLETKQVRAHRYLNTLVRRQKEVQQKLSGLRKDRASELLRLQQLQQKKGVARGELDGLLQRQNQLKGRIQQLEKRELASKAQLSQVKAALQATQRQTRENTKLRAQVFKMSTEMSQMKSQMNANKVRISKLDLGLKEVQKQARDLRGVGQDHSGKLAALASTDQKLNKKVEGLQHEVGQLSTEFKKHQIKALASANRLARLQQILLPLPEQLKTIKQNIQKHRQGLARAASALAKLNEQSSSLDQKVQTHNKQLQKIGKAMPSMQGKIQLLSKKVESHKGKLARVGEMMQPLRDQIVALNKQASWVTKKVGQLNETSRTSSLKLARMKEKLQPLLSQIAQLKKTGASFSKKISQLDKQVRSLKRHFEQPVRDGVGPGTIRP